MDESRSSALPNEMTESSRQLTVGRLPSWRVILILLVLAGGGALSIGAMFVITSGSLLRALSALWAVGAGAYGARLQSWWVVACPGAMLGLVLLWEAIYGPESWASTYVVMLGMAFTVSALAGTIPGVLLGKRRQAAAASGSVGPKDGNLEQD